MERLLGFCLFPWNLGASCIGCYSSLLAILKVTRLTKPYDFLLPLDPESKVGWGGGGVRYGSVSPHYCKNIL